MLAHLRALVNRVELNEIPVAGRVMAADTGGPTGGRVESFVVEPPTSQDSLKLCLVPVNCSCSPSPHTRKW